MTATSTSTVALDVRPCGSLPVVWVTGSPRGCAFASQQLHGYRPAMGLAEVFAKSQYLGFNFR
jgi:hypothetical protein